MEYLKSILISGAVALMVTIAVIMSNGAPTPPPHAGAVAGPDIASPYLQWGGVTTYNAAVSAAATSSTICSIQNPSSATTTIMSASFNLTGGVLGAAQTLDISTSTTAYASSSPALVYAVSIPSSGVLNAGWLPNATTTNGNLLPSQRVDGTSFYVLGPSQYLNFRLATGTPGTYAAASYLAGTCRATLRVN